MTPDHTLTSPATTPGHDASERRRLAFVVVAVFLFQGLLLFGYKYFEERADDPAAGWVDHFINETTGALGALLLFPIIYWLCSRYRLRPGVWWKALVAFALAFPVLSVAHTFMNWGFRSVLYPLFGVPHGYGPIGVRIVQETFSDIWSFLIVVVLVYAYLHLRDSRAFEVEAARLQTELGRARLNDLQARLNPHFLFNTLNAISAHIRDDPEGAERMVDGLSALLRRSLSASEAQESTVSDEVEMLHAYIAIMRERMGERVRVEVEVDDAVRGASIPTLLLQPLVENAMEHGIGPRAAGGTVSVRIRRQGDRLAVDVEDDGVGLSSSPEEALRSGFGLSATAERVARLYREKGTLALESADPGTRVVVRLPLRAPKAAPSSRARREAAAVP